MNEKTMKVSSKKAKREIAGKRNRKISQRNEKN
jgi:hypothetical protein